MGYWAVIFLDDNSIYLGFIGTYRYDPDATDQDFLLAKAKRVDENLNVQYEIDGLGVYLNTRNVKRIEYYQGEFQRTKRTLSRRIPGNPDLT